MPDDPHESSFMKAAQHQVDQLTRANRVNRNVIGALCVITMLVVATCIVLVIVAADQHSTDAQLRATVAQLRLANSQLRQESITTCQGGNSYKAGDKRIWDELFTISYASSPPTAKNRKLGEEFLAYVSRVDAPHNCVALYSGR